jgi:hypothetical protein
MISNVDIIKFKENVLRTKIALSSAYDHFGEAKIKGVLADKDTTFICHMHYMFFQSEFSDLLKITLMTKRAMKKYNSIWRRIGPCYKVASASAREAYVHYDEDAIRYFNSHSIDEYYK